MQSKTDEIYNGTVTGLTAYGAFVKLENGESGMIHISEVASVYVKEIKDFLTEGQEVKVKVISVKDNKIGLSIKALETPAKPEKKFRDRNSFGQNEQPARGGRRFSASSSHGSSQAGADINFEEMMAKFKQESDERIGDLKRSADFKGNGRRGNKN